MKRGKKKGTGGKDEKNPEDCRRDHGCDYGCIFNFVRHLFL